MGFGPLGIGRVSTMGPKLIDVTIMGLVRSPDCAPFVRIFIGETELTIDPEEARGLASNIFQVATRAEVDAAIHRMSQDRQKGAALIVQIAQTLTAMEAEARAKAN